MRPIYDRAPLKISYYYERLVLDHAKAYEFGPHCRLLLGAYMTATFEKFPLLFIGRDHHFLPSRSCRSLSPARSTCVLVSRTANREWRTPVIQGRSQVFRGAQKQGQPVLFGELEKDPIKPF